MNKYSSILIVFICVLCNSCALIFTRTPDEHSLSFTSTPMIDCGKVESGVTGPYITDIKDCIFSSLQQRKPFYVWYWLGPIDSRPASGLLLNKDGELFIGWYDSFALFHGSYFRASKCSSWRTTGDGASRKVICSNSNNEKMYLFELDEFVEIDGQ